jgi:hypothetical protein
MPAKIVLKKFGRLSIPLDWEDSSRHDFQKQKTIFFKKRFLKKSKSNPSKDGTNRRFYQGLDNFRTKWFCKNCYHLFNLKPAKKHKTLLEYDLICPHCKSDNILHGAALSIAIRNNVPVSEISKLFGDYDSEMEFSVIDKSKYYPVME